MLITLILMGKLLEARAKGRTSSAIRAPAGAGRQARAGGPRRRGARGPGERGPGGRSRGRAARARRSRWTVKCVQGRAAWTSRCSPARACPGTRGPAIAVFGATLNGPARCASRRPRSGGRRRWLRSSAWCSRPRPPRRRCSVWPTWSPPYFVPAVVAVALMTFAGWLLADRRLHPSAAEHDRGAGDRLPLRSGTGHAHRDHGGLGGGRRPRHPVQGRRGAGAGPGAAGAGAGQDRYADPGRAAAHRCYRAGAGAPRRAVVPAGVGRARLGAPHRPGPGGRGGAAGDRADRADHLRGPRRTRPGGAGRRAERRDRHPPAAGAGGDRSRRRRGGLACA